MKEVLIPDEFQMDYTKSEEEMDKAWKEYTEKAKKAFEALEKMRNEA